ncbi:MAG: M24 family metallopeptidase [Anaerolineae bacterium]|jgi:Xaa-Pro aminopeptidase|nr:M24 family metallopeptidase [Anaerolineae bacterium]
MKTDLDRLMSARRLDALVIVGGEDYSPLRDYLTQGVHIGRELILKKHGAAPLLIVGGMELDEARKSGLAVRTYADLGYLDLLQSAGGDVLKAGVAFWGRALAEIGITSGRVGVYGRGDVNYFIVFIDLLREAYPAVQFVGEAGLTLFDEAMLTKDEDEIARLKSVAERTVSVIEATWNYIAGHRLAADETVVQPDGTPLTVGDVKRFVIRELLERGLEDTDMIFAQGRDAGYPHSRGAAGDVLRAGRSIVFDLFPREMGGGYYHDMTRTWCIGYAPPAVQAAYDDVLTAFEMAVEAFGAGKKTHLVQEAVLNYFEARGHQTARSHPGTLEGYVHSLGHGVGLNIHERPGITHLRQEDSFQPGNCITLEPGLYYPEQGFGVRVEDLFVVTAAGELVSLTPFRKDLVIPMLPAEPPA